MRRRLTRRSVLWVPANRRGTGDAPASPPPPPPPPDGAPPPPLPCTRRRRTAAATAEASCDEIPVRAVPSEDLLSLPAKPVVRSAPAIACPMRVNRRDLLKVTGAAGAAAALTGLAACRSSSSQSTTPGTSSVGAKSPPASLTGRVVRASDADYTTASSGWDQLFTHYPLGIVFAQETQDVVNALTWARQNDVALRVRSGRHNLEGWSNVDNGLVIDVSELKSARIDAASSTATVGAGLNQIEAVTALGKHGLRGADRNGGHRRPGRRDARRRLRASSPAASAWRATT